MASPLEGYVARAGGYEPVPAVAVEGRTWLRSEVLGLELRGEWRERGIVLVFRDPRTGEEWASAVERGQQAAERRAPGRNAASECGGRKSASIRGETPGSHGRQPAHLCRRVILQCGPAVLQCRPSAVRMGFGSSSLSSSQIRS